MGARRCDYVMVVNAISWAMAFVCAVLYGAESGWFIALVIVQWCFCLLSSVILTKQSLVPRVRLASIIGILLAPPLTGCVWVPLAWLVVAVITTNVCKVNNAESLMITMACVFHVVFFTIVVSILTRRVRHAIAPVVLACVLLAIDLIRPVQSQDANAAQMGIAATSLLLMLASLLWGICRFKDTASLRKCSSCGYDLIGLSGRRCPECGTIQLLVDRVP